MITRFLDCELDHDARLLRRADTPVHLSPKAFEVLVLLLSRRPAAVSKVEILDTVWPGTFVTDASLARTVHEVRVAIGGVGLAAIRTLHGHGYAFQATAVAERARPVAVYDAQPIVEDAPPIRGWLLVGGRAVALRDGDVLVGRDPATAIPVESRLASWHHARLVVTGEGVAIEDLGSKNGTTVRGHRLDGRWLLQDDDDLVIGGLRMVFRSGERVLPTKTDTMD